MPWVVGVLTALYLATDLAAYLPALFGSTQLQDAAALPPILIGLFWALLGAAIVRRRVPFQR